MSDLRKRGLVKITNGKYEKDGQEKTRYVTVGEYFATDHNGRQAIKLYATAFSDEKWLNIYIDDEFKPMPQAKVIEDIPPTDEDMDKPIDLSELPF